MSTLLRSLGSAQSNLQMRRNFCGVSGELVALHAHLVPPLPMFTGKAAKITVVLQVI